MSYLTNSNIFFTLKIESVSIITMFGLKMMVKSGLVKTFLKFLHAGDYFPLLHKSAQNHKFSYKNNYLSAWKNFKTIFTRPLFTIIFRPKIVFLDTDSILRVKTMVWISQVRRVKEAKPSKKLEKETSNLRKVIGFNWSGVCKFKRIWNIFHLALLAFF